MDVDYNSNIQNAERARLPVAALDPGRTTGYALASLETECLYIAYDEAEMDHEDTFWWVKRIPRTATIICEDFEFRQGARTGLDLYPVELIGVVKATMSFDNRAPHMQKAAQGKGYYSDEILKKHDLYRKGFAHGRDACRHLLHWYMFGPGYQYNMNQKVYLAEEEWVRGRWRGES